jgi:hypothetical protein
MAQRPSLWVALRRELERREREERQAQQRHLRSIREAEQARDRAIRRSQREEAAERKRHEQLAMKPGRLRLPHEPMRSKIGWRRCGHCWCRRLTQKPIFPSRH